MVRTRTWLGSAAVATLAMIGMGCGGGSSNPLVGTWVTPFTSAILSGTVTVDVNADGTLSVIENGTSTSCTGAETWTGYNWSATPAEIVFSGTGSCTGGITCGPVTLNCSGSQAFQAGSCAYTLSNNNGTLTLMNCTGTSNGTYIRQN